MKRFSDDVLKAVGNAAGEVLAEVAAADANTKKVYDSFIKFRKDIMGWTRLSETAYTAARALDYKYN